MATKHMHAGRMPNIVLIVADDLGFGDLGCYGATRIPTPNVDRLAAGGLRFTNAHAAAATCTPSRYAMLTGMYPWRKKGTGILPGDAALIIEPGSATLPAILKRAGYRTGVVGKWHLGLGGPEGPDWNGDIKPGPLEVGFDYCFLMPATCDRVPCVYVENHRVVGLDPADPIRVSYKAPIGDEPTGKERPDLLKVRPSHGHDQTIVNGISRIGYMTGGKSARWVDEDMADTFTSKAISFIERNASGPFFLYFATHDPHVPRVPHPRFVGKSGCGARGDAIVQFDWCVGEIMAALGRHGLTQDTIVIVTSDNGPVVDDGYADGAVEKLGDHTPAGPLRGGKYSIFEGGTRVPFVLSRPGLVKPGASDALVCLMDLAASCAALTGQSLGAGDAFDSANVLPALLGESPTGRDELVEQAGSLALLGGHMKVIEPSRGAAYAPLTDTELGNAPEPQLYDLKADLGERKNLAAERPESVVTLRERLERVRQRRPRAVPPSM
ncbi:MAG: arylsulfatase [Armatimonadetes bacterium]|nr:arylsulfatase [Armatimonadota bacterium]